MATAEFLRASAANTDAATAVRIFKCQHAAARKTDTYLLALAELLRAQDVAKSALDGARAAQKAANRARAVARDVFNLR